MGVEAEGSSLKLGRLKLDHTHVDCALIMNQYPGGCMIEVAHQHDSTFCFVHELDNAVMVAFSDDVDDYTVLGHDDFKAHPRFMERRERLLLLLPQWAFEALEQGFADLID